MKKIIPSTCSALLMFTIAIGQQFPKYSIVPAPSAPVKSFVDPLKAFENDQHTKSYQKLPPLSHFHTDDHNRIIDQEGQRAFICNSELPNYFDVFDWKKTHTVKDGMRSFKKYIEENRQMEYLDVYQQYGAWLLITRFDMLSDTSASNLEDVNFLVNNLIEAKYKGFELLYNSLQFLGNNKQFNDSVTSYCSAIEKYGLVDSASNARIREYSLHPVKSTLNEFDQKMMQQYYFQKIRDWDFLEKIRVRNFKDGN